MQDNINNVLKEYFGFDSFRNGQDEIILSILNGKDTLTVMPTGGGKSLCYQLPALMMEGTALVISPLIALMKDQVDSLIQMDYPATFINSSLSYGEISNRLSLVKSGRVKLLYIAPERLESRRFLKELSEINISFIAVDEAHCISEWGHDFRPSYLKIHDIFQYIQRIPVIALTATATTEVQKDIVHSMKLKNPELFIRGFDRPNLRYQCINASNKSERIINLLRKTKNGSTIIYAGSRKRVNMFAEEINNAGIIVGRYHAGLSELERKQEQEKFANNENSIVVATNAFGMGIDKSNVRNVIHVDYTSTLEAYYQEAGRAGRDGEESVCLLLYEPQDYYLQDFFIKSSYPDKDDIIQVYDLLFDSLSTGVGSVSVHSVFLSESEIANKLALPFMTVHSIIRLFEKNKVLVKGGTKGYGRIKLTQSRDEIFEYYESLPENRKLILEALLRSVSSNSFRESVEFDVSNLIAKHSLSLKDFNQSMKMFSQSGIINYKPPKTSSGITLLMERFDTANIPIDFDKINKRRKIAYQKFDIVKRYAATSECKRNFILEYFGEQELSTVCGKCSSCSSISRTVAYSEKEKYLLDEILKAVANLGENFGKIMICDFLKGRRTKKIVSRHLFTIEGYGAARDIRQSEIQTAVEQSILNGFLTQSTGMYPILKLTVKGKKRTRQYPVKKYSYSEQGPANPGEIYEKLKVLREKHASQIGIQPRGIISDKTMRTLAKIQPKTLEAMYDVRGVSPAFVENFGSDFLDLINDEINIIESTNRKKEKQAKAPRQLKILDLIHREKALNEIADELNLTAAESAKLIQNLLESGEDLNLKYMFDERLFVLVSSFIGKYPNALLKDVKSELNIKVNLPLLRIMIAKARKENQF